MQSIPLALKSELTVTKNTQNIQTITLIREIKTIRSQLLNTLPSKINQHRIFSHLYIQSVITIITLSSLFISRTRQSKFNVIKRD